MSQQDSRMPSNDDVTVLSRKTEIHGGTIHVAHDLTVRGLIEGEVRVGGKAVVAAGAEIKGLLHAREAIVAGCVRGEVAVKQTLTLRSTAVVDGTATAARLVVEEGSSGSVSLRIGDREFFDLLEKRRIKAREELARVRARSRGDSDQQREDVAASASDPSSKASTDRLIGSKEMREFLSVEPSEHPSSSETVVDTARRSEDLN